MREKDKTSKGKTLFRIHEYDDKIHAEVLDDLQLAEYGYKYRVPDGVVLPPYVTPDRYHFSMDIKTRTGDICYVSFPKSGSTWLAYTIILQGTPKILPYPTIVLKDSRAGQDIIPALHTAGMTDLTTECL